MIMNIYPVDVLLFRDARPFSMEQGTARSTAPMPSTIAGAIRSKILIHNRMNSKSREFVSYGNPDEAEKMGMKGVFLCSGDEMMFPAPFDVVRTKKKDENEVFIVEPMEIHGHRYLGGKHLHFKPAESRFLSSTDFKNYLEGRFKGISRKINPFCEEERIGIEIDRIKGTARESRLYRVSFLRLNKEAFLSIWFDGKEIEDYLPESGYLKLGGESRSAYYELKDEKGELFGYRLPQEVLEKINEMRRFRVYLATPFVFKDNFEEELRGELEKQLDVELVVKGSFPEFITLSGWDYKKNWHKEGKSALKAGSIVYFEIESGELADIEYPLNLGPMRTLGFGCIFIGAW